MLGLILIANFVISWLNCRSCGRVWAEARAMGGWISLLAWCGATQAAIGFTMVFGFLIGAVAMHLGILSRSAAYQAESLGFLLIVIPSIGTGLILTLESWVRAYRDHSLANMATATWNTFSQLHNTYNAFEGIGSAFRGVKDLFSNDDESDSRGFIVLTVLLVVALSLLSGVLLTAVLIHRYAGTLSLPDSASNRATT